MKISEKLANLNVPDVLAPFGTKINTKEDMVQA